MNRQRYSCAAALVLLLFVCSFPGAAQSLRGSPATVDRMYRQALNQDLRFAESGTEIRNAHRDGELVRLEGNADYTLHEVSYPYVVPAVHVFVLRLASQYRDACGEQMVVTSAIRPTSMRLRNSVDKSVHPTGMAVDLRKPRNSRCLSWLRSTLIALEAGGVLEAVEERSPPHFHVAVFPNEYGQYVHERTDGNVQLVTAPRPSSSSVGGGTRTYTVRPGDSLWDIARRNDVTVERLREANDIRGSRIVAGQALRIPGEYVELATAAQSSSSSGGGGGGRTYEVRRGDSLWGIARSNNVTVESLREANDIQGSRIRAGQLLQIPEAR
jgi:LysM repeat protein